MRHLRLAGCLLAGLVLCIVGVITWLVLTDEHFARIEFFDPNLWEKSSVGYVATHIVKSDGLVCICGGYEWPREFQRPSNDIEPTHLAFEGWLRPRYTIVKDPEAGGHHDWGRVVYGDSKCVARTKGQTFTLRLRKSDEDGRLKLNIE